jgi:hypothetical protein
VLAGVVVLVPLLGWIENVTCGEVATCPASVTEPCTS